MNVCLSPSAIRNAPVEAVTGRPRSASAMIHIVDDDAGVRAALSFLLATVGMENRTYASAQEFLDTAVTGSGDCLILDLQMPRIDGVELLQILGARGVRVPCVVITAHPEHAHALQPLHHKPVAVLSKPFRDATLLDVLRTVAAGHNGRGPSGAD